MTSRELIDAQFDRAVEIVQGLPKTGPIQTDYEEKLTMYSLYKQATVGNVKSPRPGMWDMLGRAKWDAWAKHKDLDPYEAKWLYVDALLKVLRKYSDKTMAKDLVQELESYSGDPSHIILSRTLSKSAGSESSGSSASEDEMPPSQYPRSTSQSQSLIHSFQHDHPICPEAETESEEDSEDEEDEDEARELPISVMQGNPALALSQLNRPQSSMSATSNRYRTPLAGSLAMSPPPNQIVPTIQPLPGFETPSAFAEPSPTSIPSSLYPATSSIAGYPESSRGMTSPPSMFPPPSSSYRSQPQSMPMGQYGVVRPASSIALERALESMQAQLAAFNERLEILEAATSPSGSRAKLPTSRDSFTPGSRSPTDGRGNIEWEMEDLGLWSFVVTPTLRGLDFLKQVIRFFARNEEHRSPSMIVLRRLCLDASFILAFLALFRMVWRKSGIRRREVNAALIVLWRALLGRRERLLVDRGV
ncbi:ACBP-domain-containing protein [Marasmius fiardii PR-910]|nr:ACBP-domain-containing protein [Marasmius fiardii PR-910]